MQSDRSKIADGLYLRGRATANTLNQLAGKLLSDLADIQSGRRSMPLIMGIINLTPDSFSDGGRFTDVGKALQQAVSMQNSGADIIDIGGESTRPGAASVSTAEEIDRVVPVLERLVDAVEIPVSVDTSKPQVMQAAAQAGTAMLNDVNALRAAGAVEVAAASGLPVCLMHMQGKPRTMQHTPHYDNVVAEVQQFLDDRIAACEAAGIPREMIVVDPGFGFGKTLDHNLALLGQLQQLQALGCPILAGLSRKSMFGEITGRPVDQRLISSVAGAVLAYQNGASILRVHDVAETLDAVKVAAAVQ